MDALASQADLQIGGGWTKGEGASGNRFVRNVIHYTTRDAALLNTTEQTRTAFAECDYNLYHPAAGQTPVVNGVPGGSFDAWQELGFDRHSVFADPLFVDYANGDYRLRPESPAFGPRLPADRRASHRAGIVRLGGCRFGRGRRSRPGRGAGVSDPAPAAGFVNSVGLRLLRWSRTRSTPGCPACAAAASSRRTAGSRTPRSR